MLFRSFANLDLCVVRGRWKKAATARIYIDEAMSQLPVLKANSVQQPRIRQYSKTYSVSFGSSFVLGSWLK